MNIKNETVTGNFREIVENELEIPNVPPDMLLIRGLMVSAFYKPDLRKQIERYFSKNPEMFNKRAFSSPYLSTYIFQTIPLHRIELALKIVGIIEEEKINFTFWLDELIGKNFACIREFFPAKECGIDIDVALASIKRQHGTQSTDYAIEGVVPIFIALLTGWNCKVTVTKAVLVEQIKPILIVFNRETFSPDERKNIPLPTKLHPEFSKDMTKNLLHFSTASNTNQAMETKASNNIMAKDYARFNSIGEGFHKITEDLKEAIGCSIEPEGCNADFTIPQKYITEKDIKEIFEIMHHAGILSGTIQYIYSGMTKPKTLDQDLMDLTLTSGVKDALSFINKDLDNPFIDDAEKKKLLCAKKVFERLCQKDAQIAYVFSNDDIKYHLLLTKLKQLARINQEDKSQYIKKFFREKNEEKQKKKKNRELYIKKHEKQKIKNEETIDELQKENKRLLSLVNNHDKEYQNLHESLEEVSKQKEDLEKILNHMIEEAQDVNNTSNASYLPPNKNVVLVGGHTNWQKKLKETIPKNYRLLSGTEDFDNAILENTDFIFANTQHMKHGVFYKLINFVRKNNKTIYYLPVTSVERSVNLMSHHLSKKVAC